MASGIGGSKGSISKRDAAPRPKGKPDPSGGLRRARVVQLLATQALLAALILGMAFLSRDDLRTTALMLWTLLVPLGFAFTYGTAYRRHEEALREGRWSREWEKKEATRGYSLLGGVFAAWIAGVLAILALL